LAFYRSFEFQVVEFHIAILPLSPELLMLPSGLEIVACGQMDATGDRGRLSEDSSS